MGRFRGTPVSSGVHTLALALASVGMVAGVQLAQAASIGHARLVSGPGEPLRIVVPVHELPASEADTLRVSIPPGPDWAAAGLSPPVALDSLGFDIGPGFAPETRLITLRSSQPFSGQVVDLLIDVGSASGRQRHQVSLLAPAGASVSPPATASTGSDAGAQGRQVRVREGDNLFGIARRNAVPGVTVYQMMVGLYQQNPSAFIQKNLNLVRAGATLRVPDRATLTAISDREARRIFEQHARAFALYRNRLAATPDVVAAPSADQAASGQVQPEPAAAPAPASEQSPSDRLRLSGAASGAATGNGQSGDGSGSGSPPATPGQARSAGNATASQVATPSGQGSASGLEAAPGGVGNGNVMGNAQAATTPYAGAADDDRVASERALGDARSRVTELEDTVRELRDALADITGAGSSGSAAVPSTTVPEGSAASGSPAAASDGSASGAAGTVEAPRAGSAVGQAETAGATGQNGAATRGTASGNGNAEGASDASAAASVQASPGQAGQSPSSGSAEGGADNTAAGTGAEASAPAKASDAPPNGAGSVSSSDGQAAASANGSGAGTDAANGGQQVPASGGGDGSAHTNTAASGPAATANGQSGPASGAALAPQQGAAGTSSDDAPAAPSAGGATAGSNAAGSGAAGQGTETDTRARQVAEPITEKAEKTVSWLQENLIALGGGVLALIVLFVLWLLRRSGKPADDGENAITEAMIREKLEKIDLDLSSSSDAGNSRER